LLFVLDDADIAERVSRWRHGSVGFKQMASWGRDSSAALGRSPKAQMTR
jgi:hypothetical protein